MAYITKRDGTVINLGESPGEFSTRLRLQNIITGGDSKEKTYISGELSKVGLTAEQYSKLSVEEQKKILGSSYTPTSSDTSTISNIDTTTTQKSTSSASFTPSKTFYSDPSYLLQKSSNTVPTNYYVQVNPLFRSGIDPRVLTKNKGSDNFTMTETSISKGVETNIGRGLSGLYGVPYSSSKSVGGVTTTQTVTSKGLITETTEFKPTKYQDIEKKTSRFLFGEREMISINGKNVYARKITRGPNKDAYTYSNIDVKSDYVRGFKNEVYQRPLTNIGIGVLFRGGTYAIGKLSRVSSPLFKSQLVTKYGSEFVGRSAGVGLLAGLSYSTYKTAKLEGWQYSLGKTTAEVSLGTLGYKGTEKAFTYSSDYYRTRGLKEIPAKIEFVNTKSSDIVPSKSFKASLENFRKGVKNNGYVQTSSPGPIETDAVGFTSKPGVEDPGIFVSPARRGQSYFLRINKTNTDSGYSLNVLEDTALNKPTSTRFYNVKNVKVYPKSVYSQPGFLGVEKYARENVGKGNVYPTKRSMIGLGVIERQRFKALYSFEKDNLRVKAGDIRTESGTNEEESVIGIGETFRKRPTRYYTKIFGRRVVIEEKALNVGKKVGKGSSSAKNEAYNIVKGQRSVESLYYGTKQPLPLFSKIRGVMGSKSISRVSTSKSVGSFTSTTSGGSSISRVSTTSSGKSVGSFISSTSGTSNISGLSGTSRLSGASTTSSVSLSRYTKPFEEKSKDYDFPKQKELRRKNDFSIKISQPRAYTPTLYSATFKLRGKKAGIQSGLDIRRY